MPHTHGQLKPESPLAQIPAMTAGFVFYESLEQDRLQPLPAGDFDALAGSHLKHAPHMRNGSYRALHRYSSDPEADEAALLRAHQQLVEPLLDYELTEYQQSVGQVALRESLQQSSRGHDGALTGLIRYGERVGFFIPKAVVLRTDTVMRNDLRNHLTRWRASRSSREENERFQQLRGSDNAAFGRFVGLTAMVTMARELSPAHDLFSLPVEPAAPAVANNVVELMPAAIVA